MANVLSVDAFTTVCMSARKHISINVCATLARLTLSSQTNFCILKLSNQARPFCAFQKQQDTPSCRSPLVQRTLSSQTLVSHSRQKILSSQCIHTSTISQGFEEFFEDKKNIGEEKVKSGRAWKVEELRLKDNVTLHKLWYVLLKERNMLMTMEEEADRKEVHMPSPERLDKVTESMINLKKVIKERDEALNELQIGQNDRHPGRWQYTPFGYKRFVRPKEYIIPEYMNKYAASKRKKYGSYMIPFIRQWMEKELRARRKAARRARNQEAKLRKQFPDSDYWKED